MEEQAAGAISNVEEGSAEAATAGRAAVAEKLDDAVFDKTGRHHDFLALDKGNPKALAVTVGKVAVVGEGLIYDIVYWPDGSSSTINV